MKLSIKKQLMYELLGIMTLSIIIVLTINYYHTRHEIQDLFDAQLAQAARVLLEISEHELPEQLAYKIQQGVDVSHHINTEIHKYQQAIDYQIWIGENHLALRSENMPNELLTTVDDDFQDVAIRANKWRIYSVSNLDQNIRVQVGQRYDERENLSNSISNRLITSFGVMIPLLAILILYSVGRTLAPLNKIAAQIKNRKFDNLQPMAMQDVPVEINPIITALNSLFSRLQTAIENINRFTANAAHELRTPLAAQKIHAQNALKAADFTSRGDALQEVICGVDRATVLVEQLLTLARLDPTDRLEKSDKADLFIVCEDKLAELAPLALEKDIDLSYQADNYLFVHGKSGMLAILVRNLVENAIRYTLAGGVVAITAYRRSGNVIFSISDSGPGIPAHERENVFNQFHRGEVASQTGAGLGLAMVQRIIEIHDAKIELRDSEFDGLKVEVTFRAYAKELDQVDTDVIEEQYDKVM